MPLHVTDPHVMRREPARDLVAYKLHPDILKDLHRRGIPLRHVTVDRVVNGIAVEVTIHNQPVRSSITSQ